MSGSKMYQRSREWLKQAIAIPGRSLTRSKAPGRFFGEHEGPLYMHDADGAMLRDADGNEFIDMCCALGAISLGYGRSSALFHAFAPDRFGLHGQSGVGSLPNTIEAWAAHAALKHVTPWASCVRFVKTGSESTEAALMVARRATGRRVYLRSRASYHGWHDVWQADAPEARWYDDGQPMGGIADHDVAAIFVEPPRWTPCRAEWLRECRDEADRVGALLVFDEMVYGGRWAIGGATEYFGVVPDLACLGKAFGNGAPIAFVVGNDPLARHGELISGTYSGDVHALGITIDTIHAYVHEPIIETLWRRGRQLRRGLREALDEYGLGLGAMLEGEPVHQRLRFGDVSGGRGFEFSARMAAHGVLWHPEVVNVSAAMTKATIERVIEAAAESLKEMTR